MVILKNLRPIGDLVKPLTLVELPADELYTPPKNDTIFFADEKLVVDCF